MMSTSEAKHSSSHRQAVATSTSDAISSSCPAAASPSSFGYYDKLYAHIKSTNFANSARIGSVELVPPIPITADHDNNSNSSDSSNINIHTDQTYALMRFISITALSASKIINGKETLVVRGNGGKGIYGDLSGILLGIHHFNNGIGSVVENLTNIHQKCPVRFTLSDIHDSESSQVVALKRFGDEIIEDPTRVPSGMFGAWRSSVSMPLAIMGGAYEVPQVSPLSTSTGLDDANQYRYFGRLIPSDAGTARAVVDYLSLLTVRHFGMLYVSDSYGSAFHQGVVEAALARPEGERMKVEGSSFSYNSDMTILSRDIELQVQQLAQSGYRYFFGCFYDEHYELVMEAAYRYGIVGPGYVWIMSDGLGNTFLDGRTYRAGSPLAIASQGVGILKAEGGRPTVEGNSGYDRFTRAWYEQGAENVEYYNCKQPTTNTMEDPSIYFKAPPDFFTGEKPLAPTAGAVFAYDSAIALGLAACQLYQERGEAYFDGPEFFDAFVSQEFEGASGKVSIDPETGSRDPKSAFFVLYNTNGASDGEGGTIFTVKTVSHSAPNPNNETETDTSDSVVHWVSYDNEQYLYSDGTQYAPDSLPPPNEDLNQLSPGIRATGLTVCGLVFALAVFFGVWTKLNGKKRVIKASQPEFLYMICLGVITLASTLVPLSYDDGVASAEGCDLACMSIPWLFNYGFTTVFSGLFVKTLRLNKIMENAAGGKKMKVTKREVLQYYFAILMVNTIVLVIWTKIDPLTWTRIETGVYDNLGRSADSYGVCKSNNIIPYIVVLFIVNFSTVILANYQSYRARNLSTEFSESKYISIIMASVFQTIVIGMPLYILVAKDPMASYIVLTCIIGALCLMTLVLLFIPKMRAVKKDERARLEKEAGQTSDETEGVETEGIVEVERISLTHVKADVDDGENEDNEGGDNTSEGENTSGSFWGRASALFYGGDPEKGEEGKGKSDEEVFMSSRSIFVGTLVRRDS